VQAAEWDLQAAQLALEETELAVDEMVLVAPFSGTVTAVNVDVGEEVGTDPIITLANLESPLVLFYLEETDRPAVDAGNPVSIAIDTWPGLTFTGTVIRIDPRLVTIENSEALQIWGAMDVPPEMEGQILADMSAEVEVISGESYGTLLVPTQALRELDVDEYAVFVVDEEGELALRPIEVGLTDFANAEVLSGLELGEVVSTGIVETQ
jgi:RND family efflux transporter MFP subunit